MINNKRQRGQFFTTENPFNYTAFRYWAERAGLPNEVILEPFAGENSLILHLQKMGLCLNFISFDISPASKNVDSRDTLLSFPKGYKIIITNPPWLARNSATVRGLSFPSSIYDDIYKYALEKCLSNCEYLAALVPESFIRSNLFQDRLHTFVSITKPIFVDTNHPVGLALFCPEKSNDIVIYSGERFVGSLSHIKRMLPIPKGTKEIIFNKPEGNLGLIALDNTLEPSIRFCKASDLEGYEVKHHCRHITKLSVSGKLHINKWNDFINNFRLATYDVLLTSYRGLRKDGKYRRRLDWKLARGVIENVY